jgi:hypothetical protein
MFRAASPALRAIASAHAPAAFTTIGAVNMPAPVSTIHFAA